jgi:hypothetical protein
VPTQQHNGLLHIYHEHTNNTTQHTYRKIVKPDLHIMALSVAKKDHLISMEHW